MLVKTASSTSSSGRRIGQHVRQASPERESERARAWSGGGRERRARSLVVLSNMLLPRPRPRRRLLRKPPGMSLSLPGLRPAASFSLRRSLSDGTLICEAFRDRGMKSRHFSARPKESARSPDHNTESALPRVSPIIHHTPTPTLNI